MNIDTHIADRFLNRETNIQEEDKWLFPSLRTADGRRTEVVVELKKRTLRCIENFPSFNRSLFTGLFPQLREKQKEITVHLVVGSSAATYKVHNEQGIHLIIDLLQVADLTPIVSQMMYVIENYLHFETALYCIETVHGKPQAQMDYQSMLNYQAFTQGLATYLAWNGDNNTYCFSQPKYEETRERSFGMLYEAFQTKDPLLQRKILASLPKLSFWNQFPMISVLFYLDDQYHENGNQGIITFYQNGWEHVISSIFEL